MTCRDIEPLLLAERDGALAPAERAALSDHAATCPACRELRTRLTASLEAYKSGLARVPVPDVDEAWRDLRAQLHAPAAGRGKKRPLAPVIWFGAPLAAAAALAFVFILGGRPSASRLPFPASAQIAAVSETPPPPPPPPAPALAAPVPYQPYDPSIIAGADYVEAGDPNASTMVYVDKESGWLVVWATDMDATPARG